MSKRARTTGAFASRHSRIKLELLKLRPDQDEDLHTEAASAAATVLIDNWADALAEQSNVLPALLADVVKVIDYLQGFSEVVRRSEKKITEAVTPEELKAWCDGETVCPPCLVGDYAGLAEWSLDVVTATILNRPIPHPFDYRTLPDNKPEEG